MNKGTAKKRKPLRHTVLRHIRNSLISFLVLFIVLAVLFFVLTSSSGRDITVPENPVFIRDEMGRALILHGVNEDNCVKAHHLPCNGREMVEKEAELGFNFVRHLTQWRSIEPRQGEYDEDYLDALEERFDWYHEHGIRVMIDMHVDLYGPAVGGNGHPEWATVSEGSRLPFDTGQMWWLNYISGAVVQAYGNFWDYEGEHAWLQDAYYRLWQKVATRFRDHPAVLAYDLMNEPFDSLSFGDDFETRELAPFYQRLINAIREVDPDTWIMYQPRILATDWGYGSYLPPLNDPRDGDSRLAYAPHLYPFFSHEGSYDRLGLARRHDIRMLYQWSEERASELDEHRVPLLIGEFGMPGKPFSKEMIEFSTHMADAMGAGWTWWDNSVCEPGNLLGRWCLFDRNFKETPTAHLLARSYPRAVAGHPLAFGFDPESADFFLEFESDPSIVGPTEIYLPARRHYPDGWEIHSTDEQGRWRYSWDNEREVLLIWHDPGVSKHRIEIRRLDEPLAKS
mgnify:FL=1